MTDNGFIKLHRKITNWQWYTNANVMRVFLHCLLNANHTDKLWQGILIKQGSFLTSYPKLAYSLNLSEMQIRTALKKLKLTDEITLETNMQYSIITIKNWSEYQNDNRRDNRRITDEYQTNNRRITPTKNDKNEKNDKNTYNTLINDNYNRSYISDLEKSHSSEPKKNVVVFKKPSIDEVKQYCIENNKNVDAVAFWNFYEAKDWMIGKNKMKYWKAAIATWEKRNKPANAVSVPYYSDQIED